VGRQAGKQRGGGDARHTPPHPKAFRHFLTCMGLEQLGSSAYPPFNAYLWSVSSFAVKGLASERHFFDLSLLRIPSPRARSHNLRSPLLQPHHGGFLERISDCIYSREVGDTGGFFFSFVFFGLRRDAAMHPQPRRRPRAETPLPFSFVLSLFLVGSLWEQGLGRLVRMIPPARVSETRRVHSFRLFLSHG